MDINKDYKRILDAILIVNPQYSNKRTLTNNWSRFIISFFLRSKGYTLEKVGSTTGKDHSTVIHHLKTLKDLNTYDREFRSFYNQVMSNVECDSQEEEKYNPLAEFTTEQLIQEINRRQS